MRTPVTHQRAIIQSVPQKGCGKSSNVEIYGCGVQQCLGF